MHAAQREASLRDVKVWHTHTHSLMMVLELALVLVGGWEGWKEEEE